MKITSYDLIAVSVGVLLAMVLAILLAPPSHSMAEFFMHLAGV